TVALKCRDRRPEWERQYHRPRVDPKRKEMGVELLTADNFDPNPITQLQCQLTVQLAELDSPPASAEIIIKRLHVVVKYSNASRFDKPSGSVTIDTEESPFVAEDQVVTATWRADAYAVAHRQWEKANRQAAATVQK